MFPHKVQISPHVQISPENANFPSTLYDFPHSLCLHCSEHVRNGRRGSWSRRESGSKIKMLAVSLGRRIGDDLHRFSPFFGLLFSHIHFKPQLLVRAVGNTGREPSLCCAMATGLINLLPVLATTNNKRLSGFKWIYFKSPGL